VLLDRDHADDLLHLLGLPDEVLRHGGADLHTDIADRYTPATCRQLLTALDLHRNLLHHTLNPTRGTP
jgi:hypothetical protein